MRFLSDWADRFCRKHPGFGIPNLMMIIIIGQLAVYVLDLVSEGTFSYVLTFDRAAILSGQIWRLVSFVFVPPGGRVWQVALSLYFYYFIGTSLERHWGSGKFTVYYLLGLILNILIGFIIGWTTMYYVNMSLFLVFAAMYGEMQFLLFFIIPIKAKWLAWADLILIYALGILTDGFPYVLLPLVSLVYFVLFFWDEALGLLPDGLRNKVYHSQSARRRARKPIDIRKETHRITREKGYLHKCEICGRTDTDFPDLEFRYCSRCEGYHCYCMDHINNHQHKV